MADEAKTTPAEPPASGERLRVERLGIASEPRPVECDLCGWKGRRLKARPRPCPSCGSRKVQFR
ncbi:hypothetical protein [Falsiroseomonas sp. CW058]|uniref:hypothetical protein n=1 Tax=Falsiroseomonas sp. CW058 TaxID=3388664 RepID=UPI003D317FA7